MCEPRKQLPAQVAADLYFCKPSMGSHQPIRKTVAPEIPDKLYFRIGDVAKICEVPAYVLRFWETEFPQLKPNKGGTGQRLYRKRDVEMALRIKSLLYDQGYTIPGARQVFRADGKAKETPVAPVEEPVVEVAAPSKEKPVVAFAPPSAPVDSGAAMRRDAQFRHLRDDLRELLDLLGGPVGESKPAQPKPMRPRLVLEPRPVAVAKPEPPRLQLAQRDLFAMDSADSAE